MSTRKRIVLIFVALAVVALLWWSFQPEPVPVSLAEVGRGPLQVTIEQEGMTRVRERYVVAAPVTGTLERIRLDVGDTVQRGEVLVHVNPALSQPLDPRTRAQAEAQVAEAEAAYELARAELGRVRPLYERGDISRSDFDQARTAADRARASLAAARAVLAAADETSSDGRVPVVAPVDGTVLALERESAGPVTAGAPLLALGDPADLEVAVDVLSTDAVRLAPGMRVLLDRWGGGDLLEARVRRIEPAAFTKVSALGVEEQRVWVIVEITAPRAQWRDLGDRYRVEARFVVWEASDVLQVPASAVFRQGGEWTAFVVKEGVAERRAVTLGQRGGLSVQVLEGLAPGEYVVTHPDEAVQDGVQVVQRSGS
ncbi:MAG: efflux RND transporter periplasmic adaptor subunit [Gammaproteobacteria bacterium]|nr:efflux RND transporter periplasmic adaptor subunit [Gammaproteobacteria bacterium]